MTVAWKTQNERGSRWLMRLITWITLTIGRPAGRLLLYPICLYFVLFSVRTRNASRQFLARVMDRPVGFRDVFAHYHTFAATILDRVYLLSGRHKYFDVAVHDAEALWQALALKRGCMLLGSHLGSFEVLRAYGMFERDLAVNVLMHADHAEKINSVLHGLHPDIRPRIIPLGQPETLLRVKECVDRGEIVGVLGDRLFHDEKALACRFVGADAAFPQGPLLLASILQVPVVLFFGLYGGGRRYDIHFEPFAERIVLERKRREADLQPWLQRYAARLEHYCRMAPLNWFNFYDFWTPPAGKPVRPSRPVAQTPAEHS